LLSQQKLAMACDKQNRPEDSMQKIQPFHTQMMPLGLLKPNPRNARTHSKAQVKQIATSIRTFGWAAPIVCDEDHTILAGHGRYMAAQQLGYREVPAIVLFGLSEAKRRALALADNKIAANAGWDRERLAEELAALNRLELIRPLASIRAGYDVS